jgi:prepilin-type processing-associated H-X9-DG protein
MGSSRLTIHKQIVRSYRCPAESSGDFTGPQLGWASGNYASNFQVFGNSDSVQLSPMLSTSNKKLLSQWQGRKSYSRIRDGLSATIAMAEKFAACRSTEPGISGYGGCMWARWDAFDLFQPTFAASAEHIGAASLFQNNPQPASTPGPCIAGLSQTAHTGGVMNCAMLDGSVRPVTSLIDTAAWWALCTPNGQETIPLGD